MGSKSKQKLEMTPQQKKAWEFYGTDVAPLAQGKDTVLTDRIEQMASDLSEVQRKLSTENIMDVAGQTNMGSAQIAGLLSEAEDQAVQSAIKNVLGARVQLAQSGLEMIHGLPKAPTATTESKSGAAADFANIAGGVTDLAGAGVIPGL